MEYGKYYGNSTLHWGNCYGQIEAVDEANVVIIDVPEVKFGNGEGRVAWAGALEGGVAAAGLAFSGAGVLVEVAAGSGPYAAAPAEWGGEDAGLTRFEGETVVAGRVVVGYDSGPYGFVAGIY